MEGFFIFIPMSKILIIGRGLAGATLSLQMLNQNIEHHIIDDPNASASSKIAAGLINPIVLKRLKLVHEAELFLSSAIKFYENNSSLHQYLGTLPLKHVMASTGEQNDWEVKRGLLPYSHILGEQAVNTLAHLTAPLGLGVLPKIHRLNTEAYLDYHKAIYTVSEPILNQNIRHDTLTTLKTQYSKIIICNGHLASSLYPQFQSMLSPTRGELLTIHTKDLPEDTIYHASIFILPLGNQLFKIGATYHWDHLNDRPTDDAKNQLIKKLEKIFTGSYKITNHQAGVRPTVKDRKPILGKIEQGVYSFNGLGSRGALMAPLLAEQLLQFILNNNPLNPLYDIKRFTND